MSKSSLEELKRLIRKIEFNKTEPELLIELVKKATKLGEGEKQRLQRMQKTAFILFEQLSELNLFQTIKATNDELKKKPLGAVDGSFQVTGGIGGVWYIVIGVAEVIASQGFTLSPKVKVGGIIEPREAIDEADAKRKAEKIMMLAEIKAMRDITKELCSNEEAFLIIDGPIIDPPLLLDEEYLTERVNTIRDCHENNITVVGFVKRVMGRNFLSTLQQELDDKLKVQLSNYTSDLDLMGSLLNIAILKTGFSAVYTKPKYYQKGLSEKEDHRISRVYRAYEDKGLKIYYTYYKPNIREKVYRIELASFEKLDDQQLMQKFKEIMELIQIWTLPGQGQPLPIIIAHNKCSVRKGAADTLYYEIMTRAFSQGTTDFWWTITEEI